MAQIILGVTGSIAAYKAADLTSKLTQNNHQIHVVMTNSARRLVTEQTFLYLSGHPVHFDLWSKTQSGAIEHVSLNDQADLFVIAPATANCLAKLAHGLADDMLTTLVLAARTPILIFPAMNPRMWHNPAVQRNLKLLKSYGYQVHTPTEGHMACGHVGPGRLIEPAEIVSLIEAALTAAQRKPNNQKSPIDRSHKSQDT